MSSDEREDKTVYKGVVNHDEEHYIWPADRENAGQAEAASDSEKSETSEESEESDEE